MKRLLLDPLEPDAAIVREAAAILSRAAASSPTRPIRSTAWRSIHGTMRPSTRCSRRRDGSRAPRWR